MATMTQGQIEAVREDILQLAHGSVAVRSVDVIDEDGPDGPGVVVTVGLSDPGAEPWDPSDFLALRREARTIALAALGANQDVRLVYESHASSPDDATSSVAGDKYTEDGNS